MTLRISKLKLTLLIGGCLALVGVLYAATPLELWTGTSDHIGLWNGPSTLTARTRSRRRSARPRCPWHYHPGYVYNVVRLGTITVEDGCGSVQSYRAGQAFETSEGH